MQWSMFDVIIYNRITEVCPFKADYFEILQMVLRIAKELKKTITQNEFPNNTRNTASQATLN